MIKKVRLDPIVFTARAYEDGSEPEKPLHEMTKPYQSSCTVIALDDGHVRLSDIIALSNPEYLKELCFDLKGMGYLSVEYRHKGKNRSIDLTSYE